jgi:hypothetical protein
MTLGICAGFLAELAPTLRANKKRHLPSQLLLTSSLTPTHQEIATSKMDQ